MDSRPASPEAPPQDLWSSILDSVSSSRSINSKQIVLLGQPSSGKSALASALLQKPSQDDLKTDFAVGYDFADVRDEGDEADTLARLSVYTVPSANSSYTSLVPHFLPPRASLPHTLIMVVLDWTRPWTFIEELETWFQWIEAWAKGDESRELEIVREENRERLQYYIQHYSEPTSEPLPATSTLSGTVLPLGQGTLTHNSAGVPIVVVCTKADLIDQERDTVAAGGMVRGKGGEWEEQTDGIMQVLRTICLKYGAGLFYTTPLPQTLQVLRQYALHMLFAPPAPSPAMAGADAPGPVRNPFPFNHKPNPLDRDQLLIPSGWDSWGKIEIVRSFEPRVWGDAWDRDIEGDDTDEEPGAQTLFASLVPDQGTKPPALPAFNNPVPEQTFLAKNYDENAKKSDRDPRGAFRNPADLETSAGIVGPLGNGTFSLPNVVRALSEMEMAGAPAAQSTTTTEAARRAPRTTRPTGLGASTNAGTARPPSSTANHASPPGQTQHEVLQNFFQSLLSGKDRPATNTSPRAKANGGNAATPSGSTAAQPTAASPTTPTAPSAPAPAAAPDSPESP
ncbi:DLIC-domain-containing protein [Cylindrobasidium torrendii FP15055 ss-10]|uniref:DLIC-domain-containing protein n=1 Tax=Cylindrobasidium torrendii FP15055 ss-10 TaxID=1314674 RepID=A0A0D7BW31_9AGAR|nr:DLIC-domain-containing protein [Cylindrobasidium torrendii FP15055 ss-10]